MRPSLTSVRRRASDAFRVVSRSAQEAAAGSEQPAGVADPAEAPAEQAGARERAAMRRRARRLLRVREARARDLGLLLVELGRRHRDNPELVRRKTAELRAVDDELRGLATALRKRATVAQAVAAGITGNCSSCGGLVGTDDRFCSNCGTATARRAASATPAASPPTSGETPEEPKPAPQATPAGAPAKPQ